MEEKYFIWSIEHQAWWRPNECGYTKQIAKAGKYNYDEAIKICEGANQYRDLNTELPNEIPVPTRMI